MAYISNYFLREVGNEPWRFMLGVESIPAVAYFFLLFIVPSSPRFLVKIGKIDQARAILLKVESGDVDMELSEIEQSLENHGKKKEKLFSRLYITPISIAFLVAMFNQFSGINAILYYAPRMFEMAGVSAADSMFQPIFIGITNALFTILGLVIIDKVGRKKLLIIGSIGMGMIMGLISKNFYMQDFGGYTLLIYLIVYIMFFAVSTGAVIWVYMAEVFPNRVRGRGASLGSSTHWFFAALITFLFPVLVEGTEYGGGHAFAFFSIMMVIQVMVAWKYFPETKGKSLEELGNQLSKTNQNDK